MYVYIYIYIYTCIVLHQLREREAPAEVHPGRLQSGAQGEPLG